MSRVPKLRFKEFSGEWEEKKFGDIYSFYSTNSFSRDNLNYAQGNIRNIHYGDIHTKFSTLFKLENESVPFINSDINLAKIKEENYCLVGDLVIADASEDYNDIGKSIEIISLNNEKALAGLHTFLARPNKHKMALGFVGSLLKSWNIRKQIMTIAQGTKVLSLSSGRLSEVTLNIPLIPEQQRIASFLSAVDTKINQLTRKKELFEQYKKGAMQKIFSQELRFKADDGRDFSNWEEKKLGEIAEINPKTGILPDEFIYIDLESVNSGVLLKETKISKHEAPSRAQRVLKQEDIIFQMVRPYQRNNLFFNKVGNYVASTGYAQIRAKENALFVYHLLHLDSFVNEVMNFCTGTSYPAINSADLSMISVHIPSDDEQTKIANFLTAIDTKIDLLNGQLDEAKNFKKGLLQQMFV